MKKNKKITYGTVHIPKEAFEPKNVKVRISIMVRGDVLSAYKNAAKKREIGYQTLMHEKLCEGLEKLDKSLEERISAIEVKLRTGTDG